MDPNAPASNPPPRRSRLALALKICAVGCLVFFLALFFGLGIPILRECTRPIAAPKFDQNANALLARAVAPTPSNPQSQITNLKSPSSAPLTTATIASAVAPSSTTLRFKPFIPDTPDLPAKLRPLRATLNARFDGLLSDIEEYERIKGSLSYEQARQWLDRIEKNKRAIWTSIISINGDGFSSVGWTGEVIQRDLEYQHWERATEAEINAKDQKWLLAAAWCEGILNDDRFWWVQQHAVSTPMQPVFSSDFHRQNNYQDWDRMIGCYRQAGGLVGTVHIMSVVMDRQKERFKDTLRRAEMWTRTTFGLHVGN